MRNKKKLMISMCLLLTSNVIAGPPSKTFKVIPGGTTEETAIAFYNKYENQLRKGLSLKTLKLYWSDEKLKEFKSVAKEIMKVSGSSLNVDLQRMLDVEHANSICEKTELTGAETAWRISRKAKLEYTVNNICNDWVKPWNRSVTLRYSHSENSWSIDSIINSDKSDEHIY